MAFVQAIPRNLRSPGIHRGAPRTVAAGTTRVSIRLDADWLVGDIALFGIERSPDGSTWAQISTAAANATTSSDTGLTGNTMYSYRVRAYNALGNSAYSNTATTATPRR